MYYVLLFQSLCGVMVDIPTLAGEKIPLNLANEVIRPNTVKRIPGNTILNKIQIYSLYTNILQFFFQVTVYLYLKSRVKKAIFSLHLTSSFQKNYHRMQKIFFMICYQTSEIVSYLYLFFYLQFEIFRNISILQNKYFTSLENIC